MCEELDRELNEGKDAARALAEHLNRMGAANLRVEVLVEDEKYLVTVTHQPVTQDGPLESGTTNL